MGAGSGGIMRLSGKWLWKQSLNTMMAVLVFVMSMIAGLMISAIFFHAVEL